MGAVLPAVEAAARQPSLAPSMVVQVQGNENHIGQVLNYPELKASYPEGASISYYKNSIGTVSKFPARYFSVIRVTVVSISWPLQIMLQ